MARLAHDAVLRNVVHGRLRHQPGTKRMPGVLLRIEPGSGRRVLHHSSDHLILHPFGVNVSVPCHAAEYGASDA